MALNLTNFQGMLKTLYSKRKIENIGQNDHPLLQMIKKDTSAAGDFTKQPLIYQNQASASNTFSQTASNAATSNTKVAGFLLNMVDTFGMATISDKVIQASRNDEGAFLKAVKVQVDGMLQGVRQMLATNLYRTGYGNIGQVSSPGASTTLTLTNPGDVYNFFQDQFIVFSDTIGSSVLRDAGEALQVTGVNYSAGTLTVSANVTTIAGITNGDYIFVAGTRENAASPTKLQMSGLEAWCPPTAPSSTPFFGVDRSLNSLLYGNFLDATNMPIEQALIEGAAKVLAIRGEITHYFMGLDKYQELINALGSKVQYVNLTDAKGAPVGFQGVQVLIGKKPIKVVPDSDCPPNRVWGVNLDTLVLWSMGEIASIYDGDGNVELRVGNDNAVEIRSYSYSQLGSAAPAWLINISV